jgi:hypothetical protein
MPTTTELSIQIDDQPGTLGKICRTLADSGVNILAFQLQPLGKRGQVRLVVDNPTSAKSVLDKEKLEYTEEPVAQVKLPHRSGELARAASKLGENKVNINYAYCGVDAKTNEPLLIFGVSDAGRAAKILDDAAASARA